MKLKLSPDVLALNPGIGSALTIETDQRASKKARVPRADTDERVGLTALLEAGWCPSSPDSVRYRLYNRDIGDTGLCESLRAACDKAKELSK